MAQEKHDSPDPIEVLTPEPELQIVAPAPRGVWSTSVKRVVS